MHSLPQVRKKYIWQFKRGENVMGLNLRTHPANPKHRLVFHREGEIDEAAYRHGRCCHQTDVQPRDSSAGRATAVLRSIWLQPRPPSRSRGMEGALQRWQEAGRNVPPAAAAFHLYVPRQSQLHIHCWYSRTICFKEKQKTKQNVKYINGLFRTACRYGI